MWVQNIKLKLEWVAKENGVTVLISLSPPRYWSVKLNSLAAGDFFKDSLPPADLYVVSHVIHDWDSDKVETLLKRVYRSLKPGKHQAKCLYNVLYWGGLFP